METVTRTFLFADLRDYTGFVERYGDRAAAELVASYRRLIRAHVQEFAGAEVKVEGDAVFVVFPSTRNAIACAAEILKGADAHNQARPDLPMRIGIGLHAGEPVAQEGDFLGSAVNVASRIGSTAGAGQLLVSDVVRGLVRTDPPFPLHDRGPVLLKGLSEPVRLYEVAWGGHADGDSAALVDSTVLPRPQRPRIAASATPLVGRSDELALLRAQVGALEEGTGGTVLIAGDAGVGKSRLLHDFLDTLPVSRPVLYGACGLSEAPPPYEPFSAIVRSIVRVPDGELALQRIAPELLALVPESAESRRQAPDRDHLFGAFLRMLRQYARVAPTLVILEDLHWADEATLSMIQFLCGQAEATPYLLLGTYRSDELHRRHRLRPVLAALARRSEITTVPLSPLPPAASAELLQRLPALATVSPGEVASINERAEGNPLFLEELAQCHEQGRNVVPTSLADTVLQRVARAGDAAATLLRYLAVTGVRADYDVLERLMSEHDVLQGARAAMEQHLVVEEGEALAFRHALTREAILGDLMARERRSLNREVAIALEARYADQPDRAGAIAEHFAAAGLHDRALPFVMRAGERALRLHAPDEAARDFEQAVEWSPPASHDRMVALEGLGRAYARLLRIGNAITTYREALELARRVGTQADVARITMRGTFVMPWGRDEYASWKASWEAAEPLGNAAQLSRIASGVGRRAYLYFEDEDGARWLDRALLEARRAGSRQLELRALRHQNQYRHEPGWQAEEERLIHEELEAAFANDDDVLDVYADLLARGARQSDAAERQRILDLGRLYARQRGLPLDPAFRHGIVWINWLTGHWPLALALWNEVRGRWSEDAPSIYPDAGPIAASIDLEVHGPEAAREVLLKSVEPMRRSETWRGLLVAAAHEANLHLVEGHPELVVEAIRPILEKRPPAMLDMESFALTTRIAIPAALLSDDPRLLAMWTDDPVVPAGGAFHAAAVDHARAVAALLKGDGAGADTHFADAQRAYLDRGWRMLAHELAWQRRRTSTPEAAAALDSALRFYKDVGATWRVEWLAAR